MWTIFFHRLFGPVEPAISEFLQVPYPTAAGLPELEAAIDTKVDELIKARFGGVAHARTPSVGQLVVQFAHKSPGKPRKRTGWFAHVILDAPEKPVLWELWLINVKCLPLTHRELLPELAVLPGMNNAERLLHLSMLSFEANVLEIVALADTHKEHIPPIMTLDVAPFPYEIVVGDEWGGKRPPAADDESWMHYIKKLVE